MQPRADIARAASGLATMSLVASRSQRLTRPRLRVSRKTRHALRWGIIHVATLIFACDMVACCWPAFNRVWQAQAHAAVALASVLAAVFEYVTAWDEHDVFEHSEWADHIDVDAQA